MRNELKSEIIIYKPKGRKVELKVRLEKESLWLTQKQISDLFKVDRTVITKHINNIFDTKELPDKSNVQKMHIAFSDKPTAFYSLDVIISIGYRVNSKRGTQFRIWAAQVLKDHIIKGYSINEKRLKEQNERLFELQKTINLMGHLLDKRELDNREAKGLLKVITDYSYALSVLDQYDRD